MAENKKPYPEQIAEQVIAALRDGTAPWVVPWEPGQIPEGPVNAVTGQPYRGINRVWLGMQQGNNIDSRWCTYRQAQQLGAQVKKGSRGTTVQYWKFREETLLKDEQGKPLLDENGQKRYSVTELERPRVFYSTVFHASQIEGLPPLPARVETPEWQWHEMAEKLLKESEARIFNDQVSRAFYRPSSAEIHLLERGQFATPDRYYATALHELGHWTGHESRLDRDLKHPFGSEGYAREELRAELASYMLGAELGIGHDPGQHHAYIASWIKALEEDPKEIIRAARDAEHIREYVMGREKGIQASSQPKANEMSNAKTADLERLSQWQAAPEQQQETPAVVNPAAEFGQMLRDAGLLIKGEPVMDGKIQRVPVATGRPGAKDGAYCGFADGKPNGWYQNHKTGVQGKWLATGHVLSDEAKRELHKEAANTLSAAEIERQAVQEKAQKRAYAKWMNAEPVQDHPYLQRKGVESFELRQDRQGNLVVPGFDLDTGRLQTVEYINKDGGKWFEKDCPKKEAVCVLPNKDALETGNVVLMVEGYATGASVHQATSLPVTVAFDAGNIKDAALAIRKKLPHAQITICADNDPPRPDGINIGVMKVKEAAAAISGAKVVVADFSKDERSRGLKDFNDLHQARGLAAVKKSILAEKTREPAGVER
ncbi:MAG: zincin-like metallopeptidase domain-containing protein [Desulfobulbus sp.]|jgi:putative DNA primase/helicase